MRKQRKDDKYGETWCSLETETKKRRELYIRGGLWGSVP